MTLGFTGESQHQVEGDVPLIYTRPAHCGVLAFESRIVLIDYPYSI